MRLLILCLALAMTATAAPEDLHGNDAFHWNAQIGRSVNLGNALEAPEEGSWGVRLEEKYFALIAEAGFDSVRIPVRWSAHASTNAPYTIDHEFMERVDWAVEQALSRKLVVILNMHHYDEIYASPEEHKERFIGLWKQLSEHYQNYPETLYFELLNEPCKNLTNELWNGYAAESIGLIRETNPTRAIVVGPGHWNNVAHLENLHLPPDDPNLIATFHYYNPFEFTHQGASWAGEQSKEWLGTTWSGTDEQKQTIIADLDKAAAWSKANNRPLFMGEFGAYEKADIDSRTTWTSFMRDEAEKRSISWAYWEFCAGFGLYDPANNAWRDSLLNALIPFRKSESIRILSYNIHHGAGMDGKLDLERIARVITSASPDVVSLQEVDNRTARCGGVDQAQELARLTGMKHVFGSSMNFDGGQYGNAILTQLEIIGSKTVPLPGKEPRSALCAMLKTQAGKEFLFIATHLDTNEKPRIASVSVIEELFGKNSDQPAILAGDLNATPDSAPMMAFKKSWQDATNKEGLFTIPVKDPSRQIDYVLCRPTQHWNVVESSVLDEAVASDHRPILAELQFLPAAEAPSTYKVVSLEQTRKLKAIRDSYGSIPDLDSLYEDRTHANGLPYHIYVPKNLKPGIKYPLVTFLHGYSDLTIDTHKGFPKGVWSLPLVQSDHPHILFIPRYRTFDDMWEQDVYRAMVFEALDDLIKEFNGDQNTANMDTTRLYLTGFSQGGMGTWNYIQNFPNVFAAAAPLSGFSSGPQNVSQAEEIRHIPIWIFNGDGDKGVAGSRLSFQMLKQAGAPDVRYHEYVKQGHVIDDFAYFTEGFMDWLFAQQRIPAK